MKDPPTLTRFLMLFLEKVPAVKERYSRASANATF